MKKAAVLLAGALVATMAISVPAGAAGKKDCMQMVHDTVETWSEEGTVGAGLSSGFYGNDPASLGPGATGGPTVVLPDGSVDPGWSWGDLLKAVMASVC